jgi:homoserine dehydrogenase
MLTLRLLFLGFGNVGRELARLLLAREVWLRDQGLRFPVVGVLTRSHGPRVDPEGLDLAALCGSPPPTSSLASPDSVFGSTSPSAVTTIRDLPADIVVEMTPLRVDLRGEPATTHVRTALEAGKHVVSANKGPVAWAYRRLADLARAHGRRFLFESTVMDGTPLFSLARRTLAGCRVLGCRGVLNTTTTYVLGRMAEGRDLAEAVGEARARGFAEADPSLDLEGWDAAVKLVCLANALMGRDLVPEEVDREGIGHLTRKDLVREANRGRVIRLVAEVGEEGLARVRPAALPPGDPLALVSGTSSAVTLTTDLMGSLTIFEHSPALGQTAYGVFRDLLEIAGRD